MNFNDALAAVDAMSPQEQMNTMVTFRQTAARFEDVDCRSRRRDGEQSRDSGTAAMAIQLVRLRWLMPHGAIIRGCISMDLHAYTANGGGAMIDTTIATILLNLLIYVTAVPLAAVVFLAIGMLWATLIWHAANNARTP
jgi:hypothetical protein